MVIARDPLKNSHCGHITKICVLFFVASAGRKAAAISVFTLNKSTNALTVHYCLLIVLFSAIMYIGVA